MVHIYWLVGGFGALYLTFIIFAPGKKRKAHTDSHGSACWATDREIARAGMLRGYGIILGRRGQSLLRVGGNTSVLLVGSLRCGRTVLASCTLKSWYDDAFIVTCKDTIIRETLPYRPGRTYIFAPAHTD